MLHDKVVGIAILHETGVDCDSIVERIIHGHDLTVLNKYGE